MRQEHSDGKQRRHHSVLTSPNFFITKDGGLGISFAWVINPFKPLKKMKKINWKTVINFIITVLTAIVSSFFVASCN